MFADLDQIDILYEDASGRRVGVQTDHRASVDIEADEPRSLVFALSRALSPFLYEPGVDAVEFAFVEPPPARLREALEAAGCAIRVGDALLSEARTRDDAVVDAHAAEALDAIGRAALGRVGAEPTEAGLREVEAALAVGRAGYEGWDSERRHTAVLELGAAAGVVLRRLARAEWVRDERFGGAIPFTVALRIDAEDHAFNLFGRAHRFYSESASDGPSVLLRSLGEGGAQDGLVLPVLRPADFGGDAAPLGRPLLELDPAPDRMPRIYLVQDRPETVAYLTLESLEGFDALLEASMENLARVPLETTRVDGDVPFFVLEGGFYAASKILDRRVLAGLAESLGASVLMVGIPAREVALVAALPAEPELAVAFAELVERAHDEQTDSHRLSDLVFVATPADGVQGVLQLQSRAPRSPGGSRMPGPVH